MQHLEFLLEKLLVLLVLMTYKAAVIKIIFLGFFRGKLEKILVMQAYKYINLNSLYLMCTLK